MPSILTSHASGLSPGTGDYADLLYSANADFQLTKDADWTIDPYDLNNLSETYAGRGDYLDAFVAKLRKGDMHAKWNGLYLRSWKPRRSGPWGYVTKDWVGVIDGRDRKPTYSGSTTEQTVTLHEVRNGTTTTITYKAPVLRVRYFRTTVPTGPIYGGRLLQAAQPFKIVSREGNQNGLINFASGFANPIKIVNGQLVGIGAVGKTVSSDAELAAKLDANFYALPEVSGGLEFDQVGVYWLCVETNEGRLIDAAVDPGKSPIARPVITYIQP